MLFASLPLIIPPTFTSAPPCVSWKYTWIPVTLPVTLTALGHASPRTALSPVRLAPASSGRFAVKLAVVDDDVIVPVHACSQSTVPAQC
jgi:hypothetical protein